jgi:hypothetical protein
MNYRTAKMSLSIRIITGVILAMLAGLIIAGFRNREVMAGGAVLGIIALGCYLLAPESYDLSNGCFTVVFHLGKKSFGQVLGCGRLGERQSFTLRLFGNGGLFAGTGIFWNRNMGIFRAYVTSAKREDTVLVQTERGKILITPENPQAFIQSTNTLEPAHEATRLPRI